jgi:excisionase family DNA binding protein
MFEYGQCNALLIAFNPHQFQEVRPLQILLTVQQVADQLGLSKSKTYDLVMNGQIESLKIGRNRRVEAIALASFIERMARKSTLDEVKIVERQENAQ